MKKLMLIHLATLIIIFFHANAQPGMENEFPRVGEPCPNFTLTNINHFYKQTASLADFKGKWLILDFWSTGCTSCVENFPKVNKLKREFEDKVQFVLVGKDDRYIRPMYERFRKHYDLQMVIAFDTTLFKEFGVRTVPHIIWVDENGIVRQVTSAKALNAKNLNSLLNGENLSLPQKENIQEELQGDLEQKFDPRLPFLVDGNGGKSSDFLFRSILYQWTTNMELSTPNFSKLLNWSILMKNGMQLSGVTVETLYDIAYVGVGASAPWGELYGEYARRPIIDVSDTSAFNFDFNTGRNIYCYSLIVPPEKATNENLQKMMQKDLSHYFGYTVSIEKRMMPYWGLIASKDAKRKLKAKGNETFIPPRGTDAAGLTLKNQPVKMLLTFIYMYHQDEPPILDETGILENIDITLNSILTDFDDVKNGLKENGLELVKKEKEMKVVIIRERSN